LALHVLKKRYEGEPEEVVEGRATHPGHRDQRCPQSSVDQEAVSMETGLIVKFGKLVPGREQQAIELFAEAKEYFEEQSRKGVITYYEPYFYGSGDLEAQAGFWIIKGDRDHLWKMVEDERYRWLTAKAQFVVDHLEVDWLTVGVGIDEQVERGTKLAAEFALIR